MIRRKGKPFLIGLPLGYIAGFLVATNVMFQNGLAPWAAVLYVAVIALAIWNKWWVLLGTTTASIIVGTVTAPVVMIVLSIFALTL